LARALLLAPRLFLADEPTGHQDESWAKVVLKTIRLADDGPLP
jgi:ABC-type lipoprotein export system ATPase subunit